MSDADRITRLYEASWNIDEADLSPAYRGFRALLAIDSAVANGGFVLVRDMLFDEGADDEEELLADAIAGAALIGAADHAAVLRRLADEGAAREESAAGAAALAHIERAYAALSPIEATLDEYVRTHPDEFPRDLPPVPARTRMADWLRACPELAADPARLDAEITALTTETTEKFPRAATADVAGLLRSHLLTYLANATAEDVVTLDELRASWRRLAPRYLG